MVVLIVFEIIKHEIYLKLAKIDCGLNQSPAVMRQKRRRRKKLGRNRSIPNPSWALVETNNIDGLQGGPFMEYLNVKNVVEMVQRIFKKNKPFGYLEQCDEDLNILEYLLPNNGIEVFIRNGSSISRYQGGGWGEAAK